MIQILNIEKENLIATKINGKITKRDIEKLHPLIHNIVEKGNKVDFYFEMEDIDGFDLEGLWADLKVDVAHLSDYGKMAFVGDKKWQKWAAKATDFFTGSEARHFEPTEKEKAKKWIQF
ncbi:hypothetical protein LCGC14_0450330 [marine sediment metagenome]|uniref:STAS/SEC14 domain-containing protein n=2 Tax=root TaxID=1 RepID=A0A831QSN4_9FLAO|nr:STAS/SEC14 domain-containing protein [Pricia antarctica]